MIAFALFVPIGSSFRLLSTAIVAETEKSPSSFSPSRDLFFPTAHWSRSLLGIIYPGNFWDKGGGCAGGVQRWVSFDMVQAYYSFKDVLHESA